MQFFDGHNDTILKLYMNKNIDFFSESCEGHLDIVRARRAGFAGGFFAVFPPPHKGLSVPNPEDYLTEEGYDAPLAEAADHGACLKVTNEMVNLLYHLEERANGDFIIVKDRKQLKKAVKKGKMVSILHFEGAEAIKKDLSNLESFHKKGLRSLGLVWSRPNDFGQGVPYRFPSTPDIGPGLSEAGIHLVKKCNELGIMLDTSHLNEQGFWDVVKYSNAPIVATHSNAHALCPISRNLTDKQLAAVRDTNGLVGVTFSVNMLRKDGKMNHTTTSDEIIAHIRYIADTIGIEHVALGSDFDGTTIPDQMKDVTGVPQVFELLKQEGFSTKELKMIAQDNWIRVLNETWKS
ncbi:dipeptidase [Halobacillus massiliensis]|uniref:dipeptidase n=1 Tax=Halobacillus massiliensis TaxID=1926286 RepID=UPI001FE6665E|nr:dipeptidase [Halobacillus massiliensis]